MILKNLEGHEINVGRMPRILELDPDQAGEPLK